MNRRFAVSSKLEVHSVAWPAQAKQPFSAPAEQP
jgi:hypothetical protein